MTYLGYIITAIAFCSVLGISPSLGIVIASILFLRHKMQSLHSWQSNFQFNPSNGNHHRHLFSVMGYLAKADGVISQNEIAVAQKIMDELCLNFAQKTLAKNAFKEGSRGLNLNSTITYLKILNHTQPQLVTQFFAYQEQIIHADTYKSMNQINILNQIKFHVNQQSAHHPPPRRPMGNIHQAYKLLGITPSMPFSEMKRTYRKLIGKNHPDRKRTDSEKKRAEELIKQYQQAWQTIKTHHEKEAVV